MPACCKKLVEAVFVGRPLWLPMTASDRLAQCNLKTVTVCYHSGLLCLNGSSCDGWRWTSSSVPILHLCLLSYFLGMTWKTKPLSVGPIWPLCWWAINQPIDKENIEKNYSIWLYKSLSFFLHPPHPRAFGASMCAFSAGDLAPIVYLKWCPWLFYFAHNVHVFFVV
jgi:hypothetical protein